MLDIINRRIDIAKLKTTDQQTKPVLFDTHVSELAELYEDSSMSATRNNLLRIGVGLKKNERPLQASLLRYVIHRIAVIYDRAPNRFLQSARVRTDENSPEHREMLRVIERAQLDLAMREVDRFRALVRQAAIRYYPIDSERAVVSRVFTPNLIWRAPDAAAGDRVEEDHAIALKLANDVYEVWFRDPAEVERRWRMVWVDQAGMLLDDARQPFVETNFFSPYGETLPISLIYDAYAGGRPWLPPRLSRISWAHAVNLLGNELLELVVTQAHDDEVYRTDDEDRRPPTEKGPGIVRKIPSTDELEKLASNPKIAECVTSTEFLTRLFLLSEDLDPDELGRGRQVVTGAALRVRERGLASRREAQIALAQRDERLAWEKIRAVHNVHAADWDARQLDDSLELRVEMADLDIPTDVEKTLDAASRKMALGLASTIDVIQTLENLTRQQAIEMYERVQQDFEDYPPRQAAAPEREAGSFADNLNDVREANGQARTDSVTDAVNDVSAAERREERRSN